MHAFPFRILKNTTVFSFFIIFLLLPHSSIFTIMMISRVEIGCRRRRRRSAFPLVSDNNSLFTDR